MRVEIRILLGPSYVTAAARALAEAALVHLDLERIEILAAADNLASRRVAEKCGAKFEGIARRLLRASTHQQDAFCYALVRDDFGLPPRAAS